MSEKDYEYITRYMRLEILNNIEDDSKDVLFELRLDDAETIALNALFPYDITKEELPSGKRMRNWLARCAIELYNSPKIKGYQSYSENGLSVSFLTSLITPSLMSELTPPKAGVPK